mmetsp:Transcript_27126/g.31299  ORF Transcript_27126/g.31299 Transcript_27126/m.31299 type:complete len:391 (+) Transcript_27126:61-1233(+)|eukprot:CAMPEP_0176446818 /NCGR_PEP_ID=MMETSP0127-20121128/24577_1 /TAXON_ID=938130 /ORGANISM="Platyophrya macrostoma, Strain WH" /LENGTH=390 /DNA_ID=CAMNT_0017832975 /DNA_START=58 /DNA_END=1230 /DNA_ORIENTATION=+
MRTGVAKDKAKDKNVVHARLKRMGARFELSLFRDKIPTRQQLLSSSFQPNWLEILAAQAVFSNAAKGEVADKNELSKAFPDMTNEAIYRQILEKGEVLATLEDRNEHLAEDKQGFAKLAALIADMTHVRPSKDESTKKSTGKHGPRLERYTAADIERELKNVRFKPSDASASLREHAIEAIHAIHMADNIPILRDAKFASITLSAEAPLPEKFAIQPMDFKLVTFPQQDSKTLHLVVDFSVDVSKALEKHKDFPVAEVRCADEFYIPKSSSDDLTCVEIRTTATTSGKAGSKPAPGPKSAPKKSGAGAKGAKAVDSDEEEEEGGLNSLEAQLKALKGDDSDDDTRGGKKGGKKSAKQPAPKSKPAAKQAAPKQQQHKGKYYDSDEEEDDA